MTSHLAVDHHHILGLLGQEPGCDAAPGLGPNARAFGKTNGEGTSVSGMKKCVKVLKQIETKLNTPTQKLLQV